MGDYGNAMARNPDAGVQSRSKGQIRAEVIQQKLIAQSHVTGLTSNLLKLFEPRPPLEYKQPIEKSRPPAYTGIAQFVSQFAEPGDPEYAHPFTKGETRAEKKARICQLKLEQGAAKVAEELQKCKFFLKAHSPFVSDNSYSIVINLISFFETFADDPQSDPNATGDPYKTLFVAGLNYETPEHRIKKVFEAYGPIKRVSICVKFYCNLHQPGILDPTFYSNCVDVVLDFNTHFEALHIQALQVRLVTDKETGKPRGYAFVEFAHTRDMKNAYKHADGIKLDNKRLLVDVERGRTVPNWRPRRLGGGIGSSRISGEGADQKRAAREQQLVGRHRSEEPRRGDHHADRNLEKSRKRVRERDQDERTREHALDRMRDREPRGERSSHRDRGKTLDKDQERGRERGRGRDHDSSRHDREKHRDHGRRYDRGERAQGHSHNRHRDRGHLHEWGAYSNDEPRHERNMGGSGQDRGYNEQRKSHDAYGYGQDGDGLGHETKYSTQHKHGYRQEDLYSKMAEAGPISTEPVALEEGEA
ncbi:hypothetical protein HU200_049707 [Digitaria exilis]|uniref:RRM domain-containing protein n=1 Tax=Digitaria exilis TaxID=1010633 RepID=A0A835AT74_9POAL|nr:hypothetical protein HU200_049707 [Digitaria exilis]